MWNLEFGRLRPVILYCSPVIVGTAYFLAGAVALKLAPISQAPPVDLFRKLTIFERVDMAVSVILFGVAYFGATIGPLFLPFAGYEAFSLTRAAGVRSRNAIWAWTFVVLGLAATALFWGWLSTLDLFI